MSTALDPSLLGHSEVEMLRACEAQIKRGRETFIRVGNALATIRDRRLYRETHATFEIYCAERWNLKRQRAYELIDAAAVAGHLSEISDIQPERESHVAPLASLPPAERHEAWRESVETAPRGPDGQPRVTGRHVRNTVERRQLAASTEPDSEPSSPPPALDAPNPPAAESAPKATAPTVLSNVQRVVTALGGDEPDVVRDAVAAALRVLARRRMGTAPETLASCVELLLRAITEQVNARGAS